MFEKNLKQQKEKPLAHSKTLQYDKQGKNINNKTSMARTLTAQTQDSRHTLDAEVNTTLDIPN